MSTEVSLILHMKSFIKFHGRTYNGVLKAATILVVSW